MDSLAKFESWAKNVRGLAPKTTKEYLRRLQIADRWMLAHHRHRLDESLYEDLESFLFSIGGGPRNRNITRYALISYWDHLRHAGLAEENLADALPKMRERKGLPKPLSDDQVRALLAEVRKPTRTGDHLKWECLITLFLGTGLRLTEATSLEWAVIQGNKATVIQKGGGEHAVALAPQVVAVLERWKSACPSTRWVFPSPNPQKAISPIWVYEKVVQLGKQAGIEGLHPHQFRHTFATSLYEATGDILKVKVALGHQEISNTMIYTRVNPRGVADGIESLPFWGTAAEASPRTINAVSRMPAMAASPPGPIARTLKSYEVRKLRNKHRGLDRIYRTPGALPKTAQLKSVDRRPNDFSLEDLRSGSDHAALVWKLHDEPEAIREAHSTYERERMLFEEGLTENQQGHLAVILAQRRESQRMSLTWWCWIYLQIGAQVAAGTEPLQVIDFARAAKRATSALERLEAEQPPAATPSPFKNRRRS